MKVQNISSVSMVAVNDMSAVNWKHKEDTRIDFGKLLEYVIEKDDKKSTGKNRIQIISARKEAQEEAELKGTDKSAAEKTSALGKTPSGADSTGKKAAKALDGQGSYNPETVYDNYFKAASEKYGVSVDLLKSVAKVESDFKPTVVSGSGAVGLMQLMPGTAKSMGVSDSYDPEQNIMGGAKLLSILLEQFDGNLEYALAGYNAGAGAVERAGGVPSYARDYVDMVMGYYNGG